MPRLRSLGLVVIGAALALLLVSVVALARGLLPDPKTRAYETGQFAFDYPAEWRPIEGVEFPIAEQAGRSTVGDHTVGLDIDNWATVFTQTVPFEVTPRNVSDLVRPAREVQDETFRPAGARILQEAYAVREAGAPGIRVRVAFKSPRGVPVEAEVTTLYHGRTSYTVSCQNRPQRATEMAEGCERVVETLRPRS